MQYDIVCINYIMFYSVKVFELMKINAVTFNSLEEIAVSTIVDETKTVQEIGIVINSFQLGY